MTTKKVAKFECEWTNVNGVRKVSKTSSTNTLGLTLCFIGRHKERHNLTNKDVKLRINVNQREFQDIIIVMTDVITKKERNFTINLNKN